MSSGDSGAGRVDGFRTKLFVALMLVASAVAVLALYISERRLAATIEFELQREFEAELAVVHREQTLRHAALVERCRALVRKPRIHAALEDDALDLLYPSAQDELRDVLDAGTGTAASSDSHSGTLRARFYRFLDRAGRVIPPGDVDAGAGTAVDSRLGLPGGLDGTQQIGYLLPEAPGMETPYEVYATPIISTETGEPIAALVLGFEPLTFSSGRELRRGILTEGRAWLPGVRDEDARSLVQVIDVTANVDAGSRRVQLAGVGYLLFFERLNPGSRYAPTFELSLYPLDQFADRKIRLRWNIGLLAAGLLGLSLFASRMLASRLSAPVERLAVESERSARFSADASHQLKTPVAVLRAGLEELLSNEANSADDCNRISELIHQTYRLSTLIEDLMLLSRMDSGQLHLKLEEIDLGYLISAALDDLGAMPDAGDLQVETRLPPVLRIHGERRYTPIILQNLLENARKYNRRNGRIVISATNEDAVVRLRIGNTGRPIAPAARERIFERFHRGGVGENVPGYGLGLNLARELARLHGGDVRLLKSDEDWTEFEVEFRRMRAAVVQT